MTWWNEVESVAIHEIGHTLGIGHADPSIIPNPVMCNGAAPSSDRHTLKFDDLEAVSFLYGGNIIDNETFSGDNYFNWDINVISGKTITFNSGSFVYFDEGTGLLINGTLNAIGNSSNGITFNRSGGSGTWGGIQFNSGSTGSLDYCTITNASTGIYCYNSSPSIRHSTLDYNGIGLSCNEYSSPVLVGNNIRNNSSYGLRTNNYSSPNLTDNGYPGSNVIRNNSTGIFTTYNSSPNLNGYMTYGNSVFNNSSYEIMAYYYCTVNADRVFWNAVPPPGSEFATIGSTINRNYPLSTNPNPNRSIIEKGEPVNFIASSETNLYDIPTDDFSLALERQREKRYDEAIALFLKVFMKNKDELVGKYALTKIEECFTQSGRKDYLQFSEKEIKPNITVGNETYVIALELEAHQMVNAEEYTGAINNLTTILTKYNLNENIEKNTLFTLGSFYTLFSNNKTDADNYYNTLKTKYPEDDLVSQIEIIKGMGESNLENRKIVLPNPEIKSESINKNAEISISNYPNPFNPETTIEYNLPTEGNVKLEVYNSLGQLVNVLIEGNQSAGRQRVTWNGKDSFGSSVASGIYFYRIKTNSFTHVKKMILMK
jgi:tetratricopeptide (TPR) repeat protein